jgi:hypothetical protein
VGRATPLLRRDARELDYLNEMVLDVVDIGYRVIVVRDAVCS